MKTTTIGRARFGGNSAVLVIASITIGALGSALIGFIAAHSYDEARVLPFLVFFLCTIIPLTLLGWVLLVDRNTLKGAVANPNDSVENYWYQQAATGTFQDFMLTAGIASMVLVVTQFQLSALNCLIALLIFVMFDFLIRYQLSKKAGA